MSMNSGIKALVETAGDAPLEFPIVAYVGQMCISGRPAPPGWFHSETRAAFLREVWDSLWRYRDESERTAKYQEIAQAPLQLLDAAAHREVSEPSDQDEFTLADAHVFPAVGTAGTQSGGHWLPVVRVRYSAVDAWWIHDGKEIPGKAGRQGGLGLGLSVIFPAG